MTEKKKEDRVELHLDEQFRGHVEFLYGEENVEFCLDRISELIQKYEPDIQRHRGDWEGWTQEDSILISYGDVVLDISRASECRLKLLDDFLRKYIGDTITSLHILPFFPSSSDGGFSVIDYKEVREDLGNWSHIEDLSERYRLMADLVINHASRYSVWFQNFKQKKMPGRNYFIEVDPVMNLSEVVRPRSSSLLTPVQTDNGNKCVWTTFSEDQVDLNFQNPEVLFEFIDIFLFYLSKGIKVIRLDAIAYLWKRIGTDCIHLPETHRVVKLLRTLVDEVAPHVTLVTETNVPHQENISYFGDGDEAHMVYQFSLPPLLLHAILMENSTHITRWAEKISNETPDGCHFLNFTASHDGIGVRPLEGLVPEEEFNQMLKAVHKREGFVSYKTNSDGSRSPYELNITYFDAFADPGSDDTESQVRRYICSQAIMLAFKGIPGIYFHNLTATKNNIGEAISTGHKRAINRMQWEFENLEESLRDKTSDTFKTMKRYKELLSIRGDHPAFHPDGKQEVYNCGEHLFVLKRTSPDEHEVVLSVSNVTVQVVELEHGSVPLSTSESGYVDLLNGNEPFTSGTYLLEPYQTAWFKPVG